MQRFDEDALVLDSSPFRDAHLLLWLLTRHDGLHRGVWRKARGPKSSAGAAIQVLSLVRLSAHLKPEAEMISCRQVDLLRSSYPLSHSLAAASAAAAAAEMLLVFCPPAEPAERRFRLGVAALEALLAGTDPRAAVSYVQLWTLRLAGLLPDLEHCAACGAPLRDTSIVALSGGHPRCAECAAPSPSSSLAARDLAFLARCLTRPLAQVADPPPRGAALWLDTLSGDAAEKPLRALAFFRTHGDGAVV